MASTAKSTAKAKAPVQVLVSASISSPYTAANAQMTVDAVQASVNVLNKAGGIDGHKIDVTIVDDAGDPTTAVTKLEAAINGSNPPTIYVNSGPANIAAATLPILNAAHILSFNIGPTANSSDPSVFPLNFDLSPSTANYAAAFCPYVKAHGGKTVGIIYGSDAYGNSLSAQMVTACAADKVKVVGVQSFLGTALDVTPQLLALQAKKPSYLLFEGYGPVVGYVLQDVNKIGWKVPILGDTAVAASSTVVGATAAQGGLLGTPYVKPLRFLVFKSTVYSKTEPANLKTMIAAINVTAHGKFPSSLIFGYEYDSLQLVAAAAKKANSVTPAALAAALATLKPGSAKTGVFPSYFFSKTSHAPNIPPAAFNFAAPSLLVNGQYDAPGSAG
jgi:branched-chain amino acid transport system substrate-binding protein